ncbi:MAG: hypothetical protein Q8P59_13765 [Dehalococcoidia bacterium]|nr:hypothetical protein [Dehalococcoidia bacterium]
MMTLLIASGLAAAGMAVVHLYASKLRLIKEDVAVRFGTTVAAFEQTGKQGISYPG